MGATNVCLRHRLHRLDRPIWSALTTRHAGFAETEGPACAYAEDVAPFGAVEPTGPQTQACLVRLVRKRANGVTFMQSDEVYVPADLVCTRQAMGVQMLLEHPIEAGETDIISLLSADDVPEMMRLVELTAPGPFAARTRLLGAYWGIRLGSRLVAMAGERLRLPGYCEISAVCVHPAYRGHGFARRLVAHVAQGILARDEAPFLHTYADNHAAIVLYKALGFRLRREMQIATLVDVEARATVRGQS
ncbi:GNAT family N-acetyltransferase [Denitrobaculum tricleocarpae]|uniref:GNAT family N-acetyltransferase n=1 Tax=Denitrobaculum tricleocarpae TaxID=2591009 RepID=A0A545TN58_9PROT|nr:GNAT family N-acetyltransferase [Denitrobaculum tricleocarpae]TQV78626.1 GNAT family N-acetyltransferase [Denitrobaculum tricleocarpae]